MRQEILSVRLSTTEKTRLKRAAMKAGCPLSDLVRRILWRDLAGGPKKGFCKRDTVPAGQ
jgi:hypothetical protein